MPVSEFVLKAIFEAEDRLSQRIDAIEKKLTGLADTSVKQGHRLQSLFDNLGKTIAGVIGGLVGYEALYKARAFIEDSIKLYADIEKRMTTLSALTREFGQDIESLARDYMNAVIKSAREFGVSIRDSAIAFDSLVRAGLSGAEAMKALNAVLAISQIEGVNAAQVADILAATLNQFSLNADQAWRVADALTNAAAIGVSTMTQYANGLSYVGAVANQLGFSLEETLAALVAVDASIKDATKSGRYLQAALSALVEKSDKLGFSIYDSNGKMLSMTEILARLYDRMKQFGSEQERNAFLFKVFGEQGARAIAAIFAYIEKHGGDARQVLSELIGEIGNVGTALQTAQEIMETTAGKLATMSERIEEVKVALGEKLAPAVIDACENLTRFIALMEVLDSLMSGTSPSLDTLSKAVEKLGSRLKNINKYSLSMFGLGGIVEWLSPIYEELDRRIGDVTKKLEENRHVIESLDPPIKAQLQRYEELSKKQEKVAENQDRINQEVKEAIDSTLEYSRLVEELSREFDLPIEKVDRLAREVLGLNFVYDEYADLKDKLINRYGLEEDKVEVLIQKLREEAEAHEKAAEASSDQADSLMKLGKQADATKQRIEALRKIMEGWSYIESNVSYLTTRVNAALDARKALYLESKYALDELNEIMSHSGTYVRDHAEAVKENARVLAEQGLLTQEQVQRIEELLPQVERNKNAYIELKSIIDAANQSYEKQISLTREQEITMERLRVIGEHLSLVQRGIQLQMQAMTLEALGNTEAAEKLREAWNKVKDALEDGQISAEEFQDILSSLSEAPFDISFDLSPLEDAFTNLTTKVDQKFMELTTNVVTKVNEELTPKIQEAAQTVQTTVDETIGPAMDTWLQKIDSILGGYNNLLNNAFPQVIAKISDMEGLFETMRDETIPQLISKHNELTNKIIENTTKAEDYLDSMKGKIREVQEKFNPGMVSAVQAAINKVERLKEKIEELPSEKHITIYIHEKKAGGGGGGIPEAQHGAWYTREGLYYVHRGEMILPRPVAEWFRKNEWVRRVEHVQKTVNVGPIIINAEPSHDVSELAEKVSREIVRRLRIMT